MILFTIIRAHVEMDHGILDRPRTAVIALWDRLILYVTFPAVWICKRNTCFQD